MSRDTPNAARGSVLLAVLIGGLPLFQPRLAFDVGGENWIDVAVWEVHVVIAAWYFRRPRT